MGTGRCDRCAALRGTKELKRCANCRVAIYCSKECQKSHWKAIHKTTCSAQATIRENLKETPEEKEWSRKITRWTNAWAIVMHLCSPIAMDLVNHEWGRHDTHSLIMHMELTGLDEDCQLFRVIDAGIRESPDLPADSIEHAVANPPALELPLFRYYLFFKHEDSTKPDYCRVQSWCLEGLRELWKMHKDYSRAVSRVAISQLMREINVLREPLQAEEGFRLLVPDPVAQSLLGMADFGSEGSLEQCFEQIIRLIMRENGG